MAMQQTDTLLITKQRVKNHEQALDAVLKRKPTHPDQVALFALTLWQLCRGHKLDFAIMFSIAVNECNFFDAAGDSPWWRDRFNPTNIGVTGVRAQDDASPNFKNGKRAAQFFVLYMLVKIHRGAVGDMQLYSAWAPAQYARGIAFATLPDFPDVETIADLHKRFGINNRECVWACNQENDKAIIEKSRVLFPNLPSQRVTKPGGQSGLTPYPAFIDRPLPDKFGNGMSWLPRWNANGRAVATWRHRMLGWLWSTDAYFRLTWIAAATDYGIGGAGDGDSDGIIFRWIDYHTRRNTSGWASGWSNAPHFDGPGKAFFDRYGAAGVNPLGRSIEYSGLAKTAMTPKQLAAGIQLTAAIHHHEIGQSWEEVAWRMDHYHVAEKACPFDVARAHTAEYHKAIELVMRHFETGFDIPDFMNIGGTVVELPSRVVDDGPITPAPPKPIFIPFPEKNGRVFHAAKNAKSRQWATTTSAKVRDYPEDTRLRIVGYYHGQEISGNDKWFVIKSSGPSNNARIHANGLKDEYIDPGLPTIRA